jgi:hypothetical protein
MAAVARSLLDSKSFLDLKQVLVADPTLAALLPRINVRCLVGREGGMVEPVRLEFEMDG